MYGWRCKIGLILPAVNTIAESDFHEMINEGVSVHAARVSMEKETEEELKKMQEKVPQAAEDLSSADVDVIAFGCTSGSFIGGVEFENEIVETIERNSNVEALTTSGAVVDALKTLDLNEIVLSSPYPEEINEAAIDYLDSHDVKVLEDSGRGIIDAVEMGNISPRKIYRQVKDTYRGTDADGVFISCTNFRGVSTIQALENDLGVPVVTANQATLWGCLKVAGCKLDISDHGLLFEK